MDSLVVPLWLVLIVLFSILPFNPNGQIGAVA